jgi:hypothetical protein
VAVLPARCGTAVDWGLETMVLAGSIANWPQLVGEIALLSAGAVMLGYLIAKSWPTTLNPPLFAFLVPFTSVAILAYLGSTSAAMALAVLALVALAAFFLGLGG